MDETWAGDLFDMSDFSRDKGNEFILSIIDVFSKYGWIIPLKKKRGDGAECIPSGVPKKLSTDKGKHFTTNT